MYTTEVSRLVQAPPSAVYAALLDPDAVARWRAPEGMSTEIHEFDPHEGGRFRISLTYESPDHTGKSSAHTDTYHGRFVRLVQNQLVVEELQFETSDPALQSPMTLTTTLTPTPDGTEVRIRHTGVPDAIPRQDNETGTQMSLTNLAHLVEQPTTP